jgi:hypothetical protein
MASYDGGAFGVLFITNVLNGTVAGNGAVVDQGDVVRLVLDLTTSPPAVLQRVVIASGFGEKSDPNALVIGPTGLAIGPNGTVYLADTLANRIAAISNGLFRFTSAGVGTTVSSGGFLNAPLGLLQASDGDLLSANGEIVESTLAGGQPGGRQSTAQVLRQVPELCSAWHSGREAGACTSSTTPLTPSTSSSRRTPATARCASKACLAKRCRRRVCSRRHRTGQVDSAGWGRTSLGVTRHQAPGSARLSLRAGHT